MTVLRVVGRVAAALAVAAAGLVGTSTAPASADPGACTTSTGVVVVVDLRPFGGGIKRGCDANPTTGFAALHNAGFPTVGTQHDGPGFVCRISGLPTAAAEPCVVTPPASRYWSYWHADPGQSGWSYSQLGATSYHPKAGSVDAWVYGATDTGGTTGGPSFSVSSVRATDPAPSAPATSAPPAAGGPGGGGSGSSPSSSASRSSGSASSTPASPKPTAAAPAPKATASASPETTPSSAAPTATADPAASPSTTDSATSSPAPATSTDPPVTDVRAAPLSAEPAQGSAWPLVGGLALLAALGATVGVVALRRRGSEG